MFVLSALVFSVSYTQSPLYFSNQNQYFLHGLSQAGVGFLENDWLAQTRDPTPVFSYLVRGTERFLDEKFFYLYQALLSGVYIYSLLGIGTFAFGLENSRVTLIYFTVLTGLHSALFAEVSSRVVGIDLALRLNSGVAGQYVLGSYLQPSSFGVLLILSIYLFLLRRPFLSSSCGMLAAIIHPTYLLSVAALTLSYSVVTAVYHRSAGRALQLAFWSFITVLPILLYSWVVFRPTSLQLMTKSHEILANFRIPSHARPTEWIDASVYGKLAIVGLAVFLVRKTVLASILGTALLVATLLTIVQMAMRSTSLALVFPWRLSVFLVPISISVLVAYGISRLHRIPGIRHHGPLLSLLALTTLFFVTLAGARDMSSRFSRRPYKPQIPTMEFVKRVKSSSHTFIIPTDMERFRLYTGVPIVVDWKSIPYKDEEVIEWYERVQAVNLLYQLRGNFHCDFQQTLVERYRATHIVMKTTPQEQICQFRELLHKDKYYSVYLLKSRR